jgi:large subunit ribosomal protein L11
MRVKLYSYNDASYNFTVHLPATSWFLKKACRIQKGSGNAGHDEVGMVHVKQIYEIAKLKVGDSDELALLPVAKMFKTIKHQCKGMGIVVDYRTEAEFEAATTAAPAAAAATTATPAKKK